MIHRNYSSQHSLKRKNLISITDYEISSISLRKLLCEFYDHDDSSVYDRAIKTHACEFYDRGLTTRACEFYDLAFDSLRI